MNSPVVQAAVDYAEVLSSKPGPAKYLFMQINPQNCVDLYESAKLRWFNMRVRYYALTRCESPLLCVDSIYKSTILRWFTGYMRNLAAHSDANDSLEWILTLIIYAVIEQLVECVIEYKKHQVRFFIKSFFSSRNLRANKSVISSSSHFLNTKCEKKILLLLFRVFWQKVFWKKNILHLPTERLVH